MEQNSRGSGSFWASCADAWRRLRGALAGAEGRESGPGRRRRHSRRVSEIAAETEALRERVRDSGICISPDQARRRAVAHLRRIGAVSLLLGCTQLMPVAQEAADLFECRCRALEPYLGAVMDVEDLVRRVARREVNLLGVLLGAGYAVDNAAKICAEVNSCESPAPEQPPALVAPPPAPGSKVL